MKQIKEGVGRVREPVDEVPESCRDEGQWELVLRLGVPVFSPVAADVQRRLHAGFLSFPALYLSN